MFRSISAQIPFETGLPERAFRLHVYEQVLAGTFYDCLPNAFHDERTDGGEFIPMRTRRPSVRYNLSRLVVQDSVSLLFGGGRFPQVDCEDTATRDVLLNLMKETRFNSVMLETAFWGSVGSVAILMRVLRGRVFFQRLKTTFLTPEWQAEAPDKLLRVTEKYKVKGAALAEMGYSIPDDQRSSKFWFQRDWDENAENWYLPISTTDSNPPPLTLDPKRGVEGSTFTAFPRC